MFNEMMALGSGGGSASLIQMLDEGLSNGDIPFVCGGFSNNNWTTDKAYSSVFIMLTAQASQDARVMCGSKTGNDADAKYNSPISNYYRVYRFDNVAQNTQVGTNTSTYNGVIFAIE